MGCHEHRYWDGQQWTDQVSDHGRQSVDPVDSSKPLPTTRATPDRIQRQVAKATQSTGGPSVDGGLLDQQILVVNQKAKLLDLNNEYAVYDQGGAQIGAIRQVGQSTLKKVERFVSNLDQFMTHSLQLVDMEGNLLLTVTRPAKFAKSKVHVADAAGNLIGSIVQKRT